MAFPHGFDAVGDFLHNSGFVHCFFPGVCYTLTI